MTSCVFIVTCSKCDYSFDRHTGIIIGSERIVIEIEVLASCEVIDKSISKQVV